MIENIKVNILPLSELEAVKRELEGEMRGILSAEQEKDTIRRPIYHYTSVAGLRGILEKENLWFTDYRHLNDPSELYHGIDTAIAMVNAMPQPTPAPQAEFLRLLVDLMRKENFNSEALQFFTCSFSTNGDDLGQWRAYGDNGRGVAIGLAPKLFSISDPPPTAPDEKVFVGRVKYQQRMTQQRYQRSLKLALDKIDAISGTGRFRSLTQPARFKFYEMLAAELASLWIWNSLTSKHKAYSNELEVRLIMVGSNGALNPYLKTRIRGSEIVPYIPHHLPLKRAGSLAEIAVGPAAHKDTERSIQQVLREFQVNGRVKIRRSSIPYRV